MVTFMKCKYSVPAEYIEKPVRLCVINDQLEIYYSTELIAKHRLSDKKLNYKTSHYIGNNPKNTNFTEKEYIENWNLKKDFISYFKILSRIIRGDNY